MEGGFVIGIFEAINLGVGLRLAGLDVIFAIAAHMDEAHVDIEVSSSGIAGHVDVVCRIIFKINGFDGNNEVVHSLIW